MTQSIDNEDRCKCGAVSTIGTHGCRLGAIYSEYYCHKCYHGKEDASLVGIIEEETVIVEP